MRSGSLAYYTEVGAPSGMSELVPLYKEIATYLDVFLKRAGII